MNSQMLKSKQQNFDQSKPNWLNWLEPFNYINEKINQKNVKNLNFKKSKLSFKREDKLLELKEQLQEKKELIKNNFFKSSDGTLAVGLNTILIDNLIKELFNIAIKDNLNENLSDLAIVAIGGYGRGELAPHSDIDVLFLLPEKQKRLEKDRSEKEIETILYFLWDLGFTIGHSTRTISESIKNSKTDLNFLTSLLDNRFLVGNIELYSLLNKFFLKHLMKSDTSNFVKKKLDESEERHKKFGSSRYVVEPNVKEGKGGLRDLQTLIWISKYAYQSDSISDLLKIGALLKSELFAFAEAYRFILSVRCHLHFKSNREDDNLATDDQIEIAEKMKFRKRASQSSVERFMKRYFLATKNVGNLTRIFCSAIEEDFKKPLRFNFFRKSKIELQDPFLLENKRLSVIKKEFFVTNPENIIKLFYISHFSNLDIHPKTLRYLTDCVKLIKKSIINSKEMNNCFLKILSSPNDPSKTLRLMNESNILGRFIPDFQKVVGLIQYDMYHYYTVDEHTLFTIHNIHLTKSGLLKNISPFASEAILKIKSFRSLTVAMFLHDIAKGREGDHSKNGAEIAKKLCPRLGLNKNETETIAWLILNHLLLSKVAFRYDLNDRKIIENCSKIIKSPERLRLLLILTVCDIKSVGPEVWNDWKGALLHELYLKIMENLREKLPLKNEKKEKLKYKEKFFNLMKNNNWNNDNIRKYSLNFNQRYWETFKLDTIVRHALIFKEMLSNNKKYNIKIFNKKTVEANELIVIAPDHHGLFSKIAGIVSSCGFDIVTAKIFTRNDGYAIDSFFIQDKKSKPILEKRIKENFLLALEKGLEGNYDYKKELENRQQEIPIRFRKMKAPVRVFIDNNTSSEFSLIEVNCKNSPGVLYIITEKLAELGVQINSASISTYGDRVVDIFYVKDIFGEKLIDKNKIDKIKFELINILKDMDSANEMIN